VLEKVSVAISGKVCSVALQCGSLSKLHDPGIFSIPCSIGDMMIKGALCDLGANVSIMSLSLFKKLRLLDLKPTTTSIQFADCSMKQPVGILEDIPNQVGKFLIPYDFIVLDMGENPADSYYHGKAIFNNYGAMIDVSMGKISFLCGERIDFCFSPQTAIASPVREIPTTPNYLEIRLLDGDGIAQRNSYDAFELPLPVRAHSEGHTVHRKVVIDNALSLEVPFSSPPPSPLRNT